MQVASRVVGRVWKIQLRDQLRDTVVESSEGRLTKGRDVEETDGIFHSWSEKSRSLGIQLEKKRQMSFYLSFPIP